MSALTQQLEHLSTLDVIGLKSEVENLRAIKEWALRSLGIDYETGDRVQIVSPEPSSRGGGWACYSEALSQGQSGVAGAISFNQFSGHWYVLVGLDRGWSTSTRGYGATLRTERYWWGPADQMPEGYERYAFDPPEGKVKYFALRVDWVAKVAS